MKSFLKKTMMLTARLLTYMGSMFVLFVIITASIGVWECARVGGQLFWFAPMSGRCMDSDGMLLEFPQRYRRY